MKNINSDLEVGLIGVAAIAVGMLLYAIYGRPPYAFFSALRLTVTVACFVEAWALFSRSRRYLPVCLFAVIIGAIQLFGRMRRTEWWFFNWCGVLVLGISGVLLILHRWQAHKPNDASPEEVRSRRRAFSH